MSLQLLAHAAPHAEYGSIESYLASETARQHPAWHRQVHPDSGPCSLEAAWTAGRTSPYFEETELHFEGSEIFSISNARLISFNSRVGVVAPDNRLIKGLDYLGDRQELELEGRAFIPHPRVISGRVLFIPGRFVCKNYYHWMHNTLPIFKILLDSGMKFTEFDALALNELERGFQLAMVEKLPFELPPLVLLKQMEVLDVKELVFPLHRTDERTPHPWKLKWLRELFLEEPAASASRRIFISRRKAARGVSNEQEIIDVLQRYNFEVLLMEDYTISEQARIFSEAQVVVAPHGSALANLAFASEGVQVIELINNYYPVDFFRALCQAVGGRYHYILGEGPIEWSKNPEMIHGSYQISPQLLMETIKKIGLS